MAVASDVKTKPVTRVAAGGTNWIVPAKVAVCLGGLYPLARIVLVGLALPYLSGQILNPGPFSAVPRYWYQVADYLAAHSPLNAALVVPADAHGEYTWGDPIDDPLEALGTSPWVGQTF